MMCLGFEPEASIWKAQTNSLSYNGTPMLLNFALVLLLALFKGNK